MIIYVICHCYSWKVVLILNRYLTKCASLSCTLSFLDFQIDFHFQTRNFLRETFFSLATVDLKSVSGGSSSERVSPSEWAERRDLTFRGRVACVVESCKLSACLSVKYCLAFSLDFPFPFRLLLNRVSLAKVDTFKPFPCLAFSPAACWDCVLLPLDVPHKL